MHGELFAGYPAKGPAGRPGFRKCTRIVDRQIVFQRVEIRAREALGQLELLRMGNTAVGEPEVLVEARGADDECVPFPLADRAAVVERIVIVAFDLALLATAVVVDDPIVAVAAAEQDE